MVQGCRARPLTFLFYPRAALGLRERKDLVVDL